MKFPKITELLGLKYKILSRIREIQFHCDVEDYEIIDDAESILGSQKSAEDTMIIRNLINSVEYSKIAMYELLQLAEKLESLEKEEIKLTNKKAENK